MYAAQAYRLSLLGYTDKELADFFQVSKSTLELWKLRHVTFSDSIKRGKAETDTQVVESLLRKATGFTRTLEKIVMEDGVARLMHFEEYFPADTTAALAWLHNRQPGHWRRNPEVAVTVNGPATVDLSAPPEEWGRAECAAYLAKQGISVEPPQA